MLHQIPGSLVVLKLLKYLSLLMESVACGFVGYFLNFKQNKTEDYHT